MKNELLLMLPIDEKDLVVKVSSDDKFSSYEPENTLTVKQGLLKIACILVEEEYQPMIDFLKDCISQADKAKKKRK